MKYKDFLKTSKYLHNIELNQVFDELTIEGIEKYYKTVQKIYTEKSIENIPEEDNDLNTDGSCEVLCKITSFCNQHCIYCFDTNNANKKVQVLDKESILKLLALLCNRFNDINWIWHGGECFSVDKKWFDDVCFEMVKYANFHSTRLIFTAQSNGTLIDKDWLNIITKYDINVGVSYDFTAQNITRKYSLSNELLEKIPQGICVITNENIKNLVLIYQQAQDKNMGVSFNLVFGNNKHEYDYYLTPEIAIEEYKKYLEYFMFNYKAKKEERSAVSYITHAIGNMPLVCQMSNCLYHNRICINSDGTLWRCDNTNFKELYICNIKDISSIEEYFNNTQLDKLRELKKKQENSDQCKNCDLNDICGRGCFHCSLAESNGEKPYSFQCEFFNELYHYIYERIGNLTPEEFVKLSPITKKILISQLYFPAYLREENSKCKEQ